MSSDQRQLAERLGLNPDDPDVRRDIEALGSTANEPPESAASPGWYPVGKQLRWWDGSDWTERWRKHPDREWSLSAQVGMWLALLLPPIGFLMGLALVAGRDKHAAWVVLASILVPILVVVLVYR